MTDRKTITRRSFVLATAGVATTGLTDPAAAARNPKEHFPFGPLDPPRPAGAWAVATHQGQQAELAGLLRGKVSALQWMFTGCSASCPIQGALFQQAQLAQLAEGIALAQVQFVSLSIDALADTPARLAAWLAKFSPRPGWWAAVPKPNDVDRIVQAWGAGGQPPLGKNDPHSGQIYIFNRRAELVWRTPSTPPVADIVRALRVAAAAAP